MMCRVRLHALCETPRLNLIAQTHLTLHDVHVLCAHRSACCAVYSMYSVCDVLPSLPADKASEAVCVAAIQAAFPDHLILGEEGGVIGTGESDYLW